MKRAGEFWIPDAEISQEAAIARGGAQVHHIAEAMKHVKRPRVAVDVGANVGTWTRVLGTLFDVVYAFEPAKDTFECLARNCPEAITIHAGLSDEPGMAQVMPDDKYPDGTGSRWLKPGGEVRLLTLDSFHLVPDLLKIDVEGMEYRVLKGAMETLLHKPVIVIEDKAKLCERHGISPTAAWELLEAHGYRQVGKVGADRIYA